MYSSTGFFIRETTTITLSATQINIENTKANQRTPTYSKYKRGSQNSIYLKQIMDGNTLNPG